MIDLVSWTRCRLETTPGIRCHVRDTKMLRFRQGKERSARKAGPLRIAAQLRTLRSFLRRLGQRVRRVPVTRGNRSPSTSAYAGPAMPDRRLSSMFAPRSTKPPVSATSIGMLGAYVPDDDGLTTFAAELRQAMLHDRPEIVISVVSAGVAAYAPEVVHGLDPAPAGSRPAAAILNQNDAVILHLQTGVYGGTEGDQVLEILEWLTVPVVVVIHDVRSQPTARQRFIVEVLTSSADAVVTLSETGRRILLDEYRVEPRKLMKIHHGSRLPAMAPLEKDTRPRRRPRILSWGVLGPGRGVESGLRAVAHARRLGPAQPFYSVAGPLDATLDGPQQQAFRSSLRVLADELGLTDSVEFEVGPLDNERLGALIERADIILLPQAPDDPTASSILADAITAARPIVAAGFPYATEILAENRGGIVADDPAELGDALTRVIRDPELSNAMARRNEALAPALSWPVAAGQYRQLINVLLRRPANH